MDPDMPFPDVLEVLTLQRLNIDVEKAASFLQDVGNNMNREMISNLSVKVGKNGEYTMTFLLDGKKKGRYVLTPEEKGWADAGVMSFVDLAVKCRFTAKSGSDTQHVQGCLFDLTVEK